MKLLNWCFNNCLCLRLIYKSYVKNAVADETKCAHQSNESHLVVFVTIHVTKVLYIGPLLAWDAMLNSCSSSMLFAIP